MSKKVLWVFYDTLSKTQSNPIPTEDAQMSILKMRPQQIERFLIWTAGWESWKHLKEYLESNQKNFVSTFTIPIPKTRFETATAVIKEIIGNIQPVKSQTNSTRKEVTRSYSNIHLNDDTFSQIDKQEPTFGITDFNGNEASYDNIQKSTLDFSKINNRFQRRRQKELKIEVLLINTKGKTFRSRSKNISLSGSFLEDTIPFDYYGTKFDVVIVNTQSEDQSKSRIKLSGTIKDNNSALTHRLHFCDMTANQKETLKSLLEDYLETQKKHKAS